MRIISVIFSIYIITFKNIRVNPNFSLRHKGSLFACPCTITTPFYLAGLSGGDEGGRLPCLSLAGSMMMLGSRSRSTGTWELGPAGREQRGAKNGSPLA